jgi:hypothetical protein
MALGKIKADTLEHSTAGSVDTQYVVEGSAKSWSNINAGASPRDSLNVSSVTDVSTGKYQININNDMSSANYAVLTNGARANDAIVSCRQEESVSGQYTIQSFNYAGSAFADSDSVFTAVMGDLA